LAIRVENIYYLLCYAWDKLDEKERINVNIDDKTDLVNLFAKILINSTKVLQKRGIDMGYVEHIEELSGVKGKIQMSNTLKRNLLLKQKTVCCFDDFSTNILSNKILNTTICNLTKTNGVDRKMKSELISMKRLFGGVDQIEISTPIFRQVKISRNNRIYGFLMSICQIINDNLLPSEEEGRFKFSDFSRDERKMNRLFEAFIRNFYKREQSKYTSVKGETIKWNFTNTEKTSEKYLPSMFTDVSLENTTDKVIIDAKFYNETMKMNYDKEKLVSANLYQLFSYLINQENGSSKGKRATGILLYPTIEKDYNLDYLYEEHKVQIRTVNLNTNWKNIHNRLLELI
jgi:5-methylcytosine-specific restriction enzyme subunit McrC